MGPLVTLLPWASYSELTRAVPKVQTRAVRPSKPLKYFKGPTIPASYSAPVLGPLQPFPEYSYVTGPRLEAGLTREHSIFCTFGVSDSTMHARLTHSNPLMDA